MLLTHIHWAVSAISVIFPGNSTPHGLVFPLLEPCSLAACQFGFFAQSGLFSQSLISAHSHELFVIMLLLKDARIPPSNTVFSALILTYFVFHGKVKCCAFRQLPLIVVLTMSVSKSPLSSIVMATSMSFVAIPLKKVSCHV